MSLLVAAPSGSLTGMARAGERLLDVAQGPHGAVRPAGTSQPGTSQVMSASLRVWGVMRKTSFDGVLQGSSGHCVRITTASMEASGRAVGVFGQDPGKTGRGYSGSRDA